MLSIFYLCMFRACMVFVEKFWNLIFYSDVNLLRLYIGMYVCLCKGSTCIHEVESVRENL